MAMLLSPTRRPFRLLTMRPALTEQFDLSAPLGTKVTVDNIFFKRKNVKVVRKVTLGDQ